MNSNDKNPHSANCAFVMSDVRECEKCGEQMTLAQLITHSRTCANGAGWFAMQPVLSASEERKLARMFKGYDK